MSLVYLLSNNFLLIGDFLFIDQFVIVGGPKLMKQKCSPGIIII